MAFTLLGSRFSALDFAQAALSLSKGVRVSASAQGCCETSPKRALRESGQVRFWVLVLVLVLGSGFGAHAQGPAQGPGQGGGRGRGGPAGPPPSGRAQALYDLTGYWVSLVTDDWRYRMLTPPKGNADYMPVNAEARRVMNTWDPAKDEANGESCRGYGAAGVMRLPGRLHITWENDNALRVDLDAGTQTRFFTFGAPPAAPAAPTWQGVSEARWMRPGGGRGRGPAPPGQGQLVVTTTHMRPGYLRKNGIPYSGNAVLTEYFLRLVDDDGQEYLAVTTMVDDPQYLAQPYIKTYEFRKQPTGAGWNPRACSAQ
jgi:hypothetical protein